MAARDEQSPTTPAAEASPFDALLRQQARTAAVQAQSPASTVASPGAAPEPKPGQVLLGKLTKLPDAQGPGQVDIPGLSRLTLAHSLLPLSPDLLGRDVALSLLESQQALLLGLLWDGSPPQSRESSAGVEADAEPIDDEGLAITVDGHREVIEAAQELELRCGEACIVLTADGRIQLRGTYITSHASATQRIVGASVHVN